MTNQPTVTIEPRDDVIYALVNQARLDDSAVDRLHGEVLSAAAQKPNVPVVVDLSHVNYMPSMALGTLVMLMRHLKNSERRFVLIGLQHEVRTVLAITRLDKLFEIQTDLEAALKRIHSSTATPSK